MAEDVKNLIFELYGNIFLLGRRLEYIVDKELAKDNLTTKQFLMIAVIEKMFDKPPSIKEVADALGSTHQNIKQMANQLERRGFLRIERDDRDRRVLRLKVTDKNRAYWDSRAEEHERFILEIFSGLDEDGVRTLHTETMRLLESVNGLYNRAKGM
jgi:DNA-binding MarR family transcriptional regulator